MKYWLAVMSILLFSPHAFCENNTLNIGVVLPLSGHTSNYGIEALRGINLAVEKINADGGIKGQKMNLIVEDNTGDPSVTAQQVTDLISDNRAMSVIGPITSTNCAAAAAVAQQNKTPLVLPAATSPYVTEIGEFICRICFTDPFQGRALAEFTRRNLKLRKAAIIYEKGSSYSEKLAEFYTLIFSDLGGEVIFSESFVHDPDNLPTLVDDALKQDPELLFLPIYYSEAATIVNYLDGVGSSITLLGGDGWESSELFRLSGENISPGWVYISSHFSLDFQVQGGSEFVESFRRTYENPPNALSALGYDAAMVLADAMKRATAMTRHGIQQALVSTYDFTGATGRISINEKRNAIKDVYILKVYQDHFAYETRISGY